MLLYGSDAELDLERLAMANVGDLGKH